MKYLKTVLPMEINEIPKAASLLISRARDFEVLLFSEAGSWPIKYIWEKMAAKDNNYNKVFFSSKITSFSKSPLANQLCGLLTITERKSKLSQKKKNKIATLLNSFNDEFKGKITNQLLNQNVEKIIHYISSMGLIIPSEEGLIKQNKCFDNNISTLSKNFIDFKKKSVSYILSDLPNIKHEVRPILQIILSDTKFGKAIKSRKVYVFDEIISRGRTINSIEVIINSFSSTTDWVMGVVYCPKFYVGSKIDFVYSDKKALPTSNRPDMIGEVTYETVFAFETKSLTNILPNTRVKNEDDISIYNSEIAKFNSRYFPKLKMLNKTSFRALLNLYFMADDKDIFEKCLHLNLVESVSLLEEIAFYITMPFPLSDIIKRNKFKKESRQVLKKLECSITNSDFSDNLNKLKIKYYAIRSIIIKSEIASWIKTNTKVIRELDLVLEEVFNGK